MKDTVKVGLFTVVGITALIFGLLWKGGLFVKVRSYNIYGQFDTVSSLLPNAQVKYRGFDIGNVSKIIPENRGITVVITVKKGISLPLHSRLRISFDGLIGEKYMDVIPTQPTDEILPPNAVLPGYASKGIVDFVDLGAKNLEQLQEIVKSLGDVLTDPKVASSIKGSLISLGEISSEINGIASNINSITSSGEIIRLVKSFEKTANSLSFAINSIFQGENKDVFSESMGEVSSLISKFKDISYDLDRITSVMADFVEEDGTTRNIKELLVNTNKSLDGFSRLLGRTEIKNTIDETNQALGQTNELLSSLRTIKLLPHAEIMSKSNVDRAVLDLGISLEMFNQYLLEMAYSNRDKSNIELDRMALGFFINDSLIAKIGRFRKKYGLGASYSFSDKLRIKGDAVFYEGLADSAFYINYDFYEKLYFLMGFESLNLDDESLVLGIGF